MTTTCFGCRVLNDTCYQVLFELRCHVWSNLAKRNPEVSSRRSSNQWRGSNNARINFQHGYLNRPYSEVISLSKNGRNRSWCKCIVMSRYGFVTKVTPDAQVQLLEMFQMTKRSYFVVWPYPAIDIKSKQWTELVPRSPKGRSRFFQRTVLNIVGFSHPGCQQQVKVL